MKSFNIKSVTGLLLILFVLSTGVNAQTFDAEHIIAPLKARQIGPAVMSGRITDIAQNPNDPNYILVGTAGGGVWKSTNGGLNFKSIFDDYNQSIGCIAFDPKSPNTTFWVGTGEIWTRNSVSYGDGLYKTTDGGANWTFMGLPESERISSIIIHPDNSDIIYVAVLGKLWNDSEERGIYKSTDGGKSWDKIYYIGPSTGCADLVMDPDNPDVMYASMWQFRRTAWSFESGGPESELVKSIDGGQTWSKIQNGFPEGKLGRIAFAVAPSDHNILYSVVESEDKARDGLYRSDDAGQNWKHLNNDFALVLRPFYFSRIAVDPHNPDIVAKAGYFGAISRDGGNTFKNLGAMHPDIHDIVFDSRTPNKMFVANDGGLNISFDGGASTFFVDNIPVSQYYHISVDRQTPFNIYGGLQDNGSWIGPSESPEGITGKDWLCVGIGDGFRVFPHPENPHIVYSEMQGAENVWRYDIETKEIKVITPNQDTDLDKYRFNWNAALTTSPNEADRLYLGSQYLLVSNDMGETWRVSSPDLTSNDASKYDNDNTGGLTRDKSGAENHCTIFTIAESPKNERVIWVGSDDGLIHLTKDGGESWTNLTTNIPNLPSNTWVYQIEASQYDESIAYAVFDGHTQGDMNTYVYFTSDFGQSWQPLITDNLKGSARSIQEDIFNPNMLYLGTELGLFISLDKGASWTKFENDFPAVAVHSLEMAHTGELVAGTHGRGIIILDNLDFIRDLTPEITQKDFAFLESKPVEFFEERVFAGHEGNVTEFYGPNPNRNLKIAYYLKKKPLFGKTTLSVYDLDDNLLTELPPSKKKGLNIVDWNGRRKAPKVAKAHIPVRHGFVSPRVPAGKYKVVFENKKTGKHEQIVEYKYPKNSSYTAEDRHQNAELNKNLYRLTEDLAYLVYNIDGQLSWLDKVKDHDEERAKTLTDDLIEIKNQLVVSSGDSYTNAQDPELRENLAILYYQIGGFYGRPTNEQVAKAKQYQSEFENAKMDFNQIIESKDFQKVLSKTGKADLLPWKADDYKTFVMAK